LKASDPKATQHKTSSNTAASIIEASPHTSWSPMLEHHSIDIAQTLPEGGSKSFGLLAHCPPQVTTFAQIKIGIIGKRKMSIIGHKIG
jgi:hypothetical protein